MRQQTHAVVADRASTPPDRARGRRILIVDDQATIRRTLGALLELEGYVIETAQDGLDALRCVRRCRPDVVLLDLMMPTLDGWGVLRACRGDPGLADLPVMVMSARSDAAQSVVEFGVQACLTKPFDVDELLDALEEMWSLGDIRRPLVTERRGIRSVRPDLASS
jgi:CheY-like chemotaxis protein